MEDRKQRREVIGRRQSKLSPPRINSSCPTSSSQVSPSAIPLLPRLYLDFESISGLNHSVGQSPYDLIVSGNAVTEEPRSVFY
jgi:hypothetical protein